MNPAGIIAAVFLLGGLGVWFFTDWEHRRQPEHLTNEERMEALGRVVAFARRNR